MSTFRWALRFFLTIVGLTIVSIVHAQVSITLQNGFIEQYKDAVTISSKFVVDKAHKHANSPAKDGDLHIAGRGDEIRLATVAEFMNARETQSAVDAIHAIEGTGNPIEMTGVWRLWCEHGGHVEHIQGEPLGPFGTTNPDHVFEIHPVTQLAGTSLLSTLHPIEGFVTKDAYDAFTRYENVRCHIIPGSELTTIDTSQAGYNYVEFVLEIAAESRTVTDGRFVKCNVYDLDGELILRGRRMIMVSESEPEIKTRNANVGEKFRVLGIPRINLSWIQWRISAAANGNLEPLDWNLPYEIIVAGYYGSFIDDVVDTPPIAPLRTFDLPQKFMPLALPSSRVSEFRALPAESYDPDR